MPVQETVKEKIAMRAQAKATTISSQVQSVNAKKPCTYATVTAIKSTHTST